MTLQEAIDHLSPFFDLDLDANQGSSLTDQQLCDRLWDSARRVYQDVDYRYLTVSFDPLAGDQEFDLQDDSLAGSLSIGRVMFRVTQVRIDDLPILQVPFSRWEDMFPNWRTATSAAPWAYTVTPEVTLLFNCPFSIDCIASAGFGISGYGCPKRFDAAAVASTFDCHPLLAWPVIRGAVAYATDAYLDSAEGLARMQVVELNAERDRRRFDDLQADLDSPLDAMPTTFGTEVFGGYGW